MLKSTDYFRCIECPFAELCRRPYCHFRHRGRPAGSESGGEARGAEYDPYSPNLPVTNPCLDHGILGNASESSLDILELERVNKAIEAVKSEVEREQRKYKELLETKKDYSAPQVRPTETFTTLEYDPGSYKKSRSAAYNPTPLQPKKGPCKYTLDDSDEGKSKHKFMEYVPTIVTSVPKYKTNKYVIDNSKPHTDMEYDPMSNYSARHLSKAKEQKGVKRTREANQNEGYTPIIKKSRRQVSETSVDARFSDSEEESEYHPSPCKSLPSTTTTTTTVEVTSTKKSLKSGDKEILSREVKEIAVQYDMEDIGKCIKNHSKDSKKKTLKTVLPKDEKAKEESHEKSKCTETSRKIDMAKDETKKKSKTTAKKKAEKVDDKARINKDGGNHKLKVKSSKVEKLKLEKQNSMKKEPGQNSNKSKNEERVERKLSTDKTRTLKNEKVKGEIVKNGKLKEKAKSEVKSKGSSKDSIKVKSKQKQRSLSHVDLFGDESSEEELERKPVSHRTSLSSDGGLNSDMEMEDQMTLNRVSTSSVDSLDIDYSLLEKAMDSDSDPMEECLRVFNESQDVKTEDKGRMRKQPPKDGEEKSETILPNLIPGQKKRVSHVTSPTNSDTASKPVIRPYRRPTPQEICYQRIQRAQEQAAQLLAQQKAMLLASSAQKSPPAQTGEKKRIAHMPISLSSYPQHLQDVKKPTSNTPPTSVGNTAMSNGSDSGLKSRTISGMSSKTIIRGVQRRQAHGPSAQSATLKRPVIPTEFGAKVPTNVRQRYLNLFIDECLKFCTSEQEAFNKALEEETVVYTRSTSRNIYLNVAVNTLKKLRSQGPSNKSTTARSVNNKVVSHESVLGGKLAAKTSYSVQRNSGHREEELTDIALYRKLKEYLMTQEQLQENSYPMPHPDKPGRAVLVTAEEKKISDSFCRVCCRCGAEYLVSPSGNCVRREECIHHWGRLRRQRVPGGWETHYSCCSGAVGSMGCQVAKQHVQDGRKENLDGFVKTFEKLPAADGNPGVYALDCEMCYTTHGLELTRVTVINAKLKVVYDTFVQPDNKVVDYNTRFSGVTEEDLQNTTITLRDVQAVLLCMFSTDTILIGHSLESDLFALKLIHPTVVDTAIVFPHRLGLPYKRALRSLMADHLKRIIQDNVDGHDSSEDACSCMELMIWKIKEDAKVKR